MGQAVMARPRLFTLSAVWSCGLSCKAVEATGRKNIVIAGFWTEVCLTFPTLDM
ncbi:hypothetical protein [Paracoccus zhejiangensis]|uniref:hypothetical protein n=1 Tax=Paracoccus zhejiangensis TaxID=1077935 RepID=UPI0018E410C9|nr:hypothetical protein [Paracoccus zhejiangensis]